MLRRALVASALILGASIWMQRDPGAAAVAPHAPLASVPLAMGGWMGRDLPAWDEKVLNVLGADDYLNRRYFQARGIADLYVGYYRSQRQGDSIHSPQNCLPGAGWQPIANERITIPVQTAPRRGGFTPASTATGGAQQTRSITVNRYIIQKDLDRQVVLYWFQGRGRVVANEYANRAYLVLDSLMTHRSDGALVRVMTPVTGDLNEASASAAKFASVLYPRLSEVLP